MYGGDPPYLAARPVMLILGIGSVRSGRYRSFTTDFSLLSIGTAGQGRQETPKAAAS